MIGAGFVTGVGGAVLRRAGKPLRRSTALLIDAFPLGLAMVAVLLVAAAVDAPGVKAIRWISFTAIGLAPMAFLVGRLQARLARSAVAELVVALRSGTTPADLRDALAYALRDPSLELACWLPAFGRYGDLQGRPIKLQQRKGRATTLIERDGLHVAALMHDAALEDEPELLHAVTAAAGIALDNVRLHVALRARVEELRESRRRILEAGLGERQRLERDLHDGAQQRLIALSLDLGRLATRLSPDNDVHGELEHARREIAAVLKELRDVAHGLHPGVVTGHGLAVALEALAARAPVPVRLTVLLPTRLPESLEIAAYYVIAEGLANIGKHACASAAAVAVTSGADLAVVEVADDGEGGADAARGSGLRGLIDRVEAVGGTLQIWSPPGGGTRLRAEMPLPGEVLQERACSSESFDRGAPVKSGGT